MKTMNSKLLFTTILCCHYMSASAFSLSSYFTKRKESPFILKEEEHKQQDTATLFQNPTHPKVTMYNASPLVANASNRLVERNSFVLLKPLKHVFLAMTTLFFLSISCPFLPFSTANAAAPVTPIKNFKPPDSKAIALKKIADERNKEKLQEEMAHQIKCDDIEREQGLKARKAYEKAYLDEKIQKAKFRSLERQKLLYGLVDQGICPYVDVEGERQLYLFDYDIDLNKVASSAQQKEMMKLRRDKKWATRREKEHFIIKCIVEDLKLRGEDPLKYFEANKAKTRDILNLKDKQLDVLFNRYTYLMETQGSLSGIKADVPFDMEAAATHL